jgi:hypothetical protein
MEDDEHGRSAPGRTRAPTTRATDVTTVGHAGVDVSGIDPVHWAETSERVAILRAWCAEERHARREVIEAAERMGTSVTHFYRLVATWKKFRDARRVSGHPARRGDERAPKSMPADARAILRRVAAARGPEARFSDVLAEVRSECADAGVRAPSSGMVHREMMRVRQTGISAKGGTPGDVAIAVVACLLPVTAEGSTIEAPDLVLAVERPNGTILAHRLVLDGNTIGAAREVLASVTAIPSASIVVAGALGEAVDEDAPAGESVRERAHGVGIGVATRSTLLSTTLGSYLDSIPIRHRRHTARAPGPWRPLSAADATAAVDLAVAAHNAARRG